jgi:putative two-component system response regulator
MSHQDGGPHHVGGMKQPLRPHGCLHPQFHDVALRYNDDKGERESNRD